MPRNLLVKTRDVPIPKFLPMPHPMLILVEMPILMPIPKNCGYLPKPIKINRHIPTINNALAKQ